MKVSAIASTNVSSTPADQRQERRAADTHLEMASCHNRQGPAPRAKADRRGAMIAALPFANVSGDPEQEYFSDGMSEDIITDLSKIGGLLVIPRNQGTGGRCARGRPETRGTLGARRFHTPGGKSSARHPQLVAISGQTAMIATSPTLRSIRLFASVCGFELGLYFRLPKSLE